MAENGLNVGAAGLHGLAVRVQGMGECPGDGLHPLGRAMKTNALTVLVGMLLCQSPSSTMVRMAWLNEDLAPRSYCRRFWPPRVNG